MARPRIVTEAFDPRIAVGLIGSSGEGGVKLHRHLYGEAVENLAGGEYYWMAGNFIKYGASDPPMTAADLPVDSHELIALCAPRPCFISYGTVEHGDAKWVDAHGSFMAAVLAGPVYRLLGKKDLGTPGDYLTDPMPPVKTLIGGELAWRQHEGGHDVTPNWPAFFDWVQQYIKAPPLPGGIPSLQKVALATEIPTPRTDPNSALAHTQLVEKAKKGGIDVYFVGDSIVRRWGASDPQYADLLRNWNENFYRLERGRFRLGRGQGREHPVAAGERRTRRRQPQSHRHPGRNQQYRRHRAERCSRSADVTKGIQALLRVCRAKAPRATIILTAIFPRNDNMAAMPVIDRINANLARLADGKTVRFLNVNDSLADKDGRLFDGMMNAGDKLHPTVKGYQVWADGLKPLLTELLGPPAATDHAPPPTGDPSLERRPSATATL